MLLFSIGILEAPLEYWYHIHSYSTVCKNAKNRKKWKKIEFLLLSTMQTAWQIYSTAVKTFILHVSFIAASSKYAWQKTLAKGPVPRGCSIKDSSSPVTSMWGWVWSCWTKYEIPKLPMLPQVWRLRQPRLPCHLMRPRLRLLMTMKGALHKMCQDELPPGLPGIRRKQPQKLTVSWKITKNKTFWVIFKHCGVRQYHLLLSNMIRAKSMVYEIKRINVSQHPKRGRLLMTRSHGRDNFIIILATVGANESSRFAITLLLLEDSTCRNVP